MLYQFVPAEMYFAFFVNFILPFYPQLSCWHLTASSKDWVGRTASLTHGKPT